jgi:hypothetical protein
MLFLIEILFYYLNLFDYGIPIPIIIISWLIFHIIKISATIHLISNMMQYIIIILIIVSNTKIVSCSQYSQLSKLAAKDGDFSDFFGSSVSIYNTNAFIGASDDDNGDTSGKCYNSFIYYKMSTLYIVL